MEFDLSNLPSAFGPLPSIHVWQNLFWFLESVRMTIVKRFHLVMYYRWKQQESSLRWDRILLR
jgi:hypothetical protein